jgi:hypothetical protein
MLRKYLSRFCRAFCFGLVLSASCTVIAPCYAEDLTIIDAAKAGVDYTIQGEYLGVIDADSGRTWGAQVIALGKGKFRCVGYPGGLPGDGFDPSESVRETDGALDGAAAKFTSNEFELVADGKTLKVQDLSGAELGTLQKVERESATLGAKPPEGAVVLFDGKDASAWEGGRLTAEGYLDIGTSSKQKFNDFTLHLEFRTPFMPESRGQGRGNSGMYLQSRYEVQILDSFGLSGENNECGGIYQIARPKVNMCYPPLRWQTYDVDFTSAKYDAAGKKISDATATIRHNGIVIHKDLVFPRATPGREGESNSPGAIFLQDHGNPVAFRNIWIVEKSK